MDRAQALYGMLNGIWVKIRLGGRARLQFDSLPAVIRMVKQPLFELKASKVINAGIPDDTVEPWFESLRIVETHDSSKDRNPGLLLHILCQIRPDHARQIPKRIACMKTVQPAERILIPGLAPEDQERCPELTDGLIRCGTHCSDDSDLRSLMKRRRG